jgi:hypothetical protein
MEAMRLCASFVDNDVCLFNVFCEQSSAVQCCELLINRVQMFLRSIQGHAVMFFDEGHENEFTRLLRKMRVFNPIPSHYGGSYNAPAKNILDDPVFRNSSQSVFIQLVDFCAYALLRHERPLVRTDYYGIGKSFEILDPVLMKKASRANRFGIVTG